MQKPTVNFIPRGPCAVLTEEEYHKCLNYYVSRDPRPAWITKEVKYPELLWSTIGTLSITRVVLPMVEAPRWRDRFIPRPAPCCTSHIVTESLRVKTPSSAAAAAAAVAVVIISDDDDHPTEGGDGKPLTPSPPTHSCTSAKEKTKPAKTSARTQRRLAAPLPAAPSTIVPLHPPNAPATKPSAKSAPTFSAERSSSPHGGGGVKRQRSMDEFITLE